MRIEQPFWSSDTINGYKLLEVYIVGITVFDNTFCFWKCDSTNGLDFNSHVVRPLLGNQAALISIISSPIKI